jgi:hypothetical protein
MFMALFGFVVGLVTMYVVLDIIDHITDTGGSDYAT